MRKLEDDIAGSSLEISRYDHGHAHVNTPAVTLLLVVGLWLLVTVLSFVAVAVAIVRLPEDYFSRPDPSVQHMRTSTLRRIARNLLGILLIAVGVVLSVPGIPGQGVLTILLGVMLVDFPGRHKAERWLVSRPGVLAAMNKLRRRLGKPPLREPPMPF
jgi:hypothetical protein